MGASHAAIETIVSLRKLGWRDGITLIGNEDSLPYQRPPLSKGYLKGEVNSEKITAYGSLKYSEPVGGLTTALQPGEEIDFIKECDKYCANPNNKDNGVIFFVQSDGTAGELAIPKLKEVVDDSERIFVGNSLQVIKWLNSKILNS